METSFYIDNDGQFTLKVDLPKLIAQADPNRVTIHTLAILVSRERQEGRNGRRLAQ